MASYVLCADCCSDDCQHIESFPENLHRYEVQILEQRWYSMVVLAKNREEARQFSTEEAMGDFVPWDEPSHVDLTAYVVEMPRTIQDIEAGGRL